MKKAPRRTIGLDAAWTKPTYVGPAPNFLRIVAAYDLGDNLLQWFRDRCLVRRRDEELRRPACYVTVGLIAGSSDFDATRGLSFGIGLKHYAVTPAGDLG